MSLVPDERLLVLVASCQKRAQHRRAIRETWAGELERRGVEHLFVVAEPGAGARLEGDVLTVDSKDNYEYLVLKILRAFEFLAAATPRTFDHVFKVDDDCYLGIDNLLSKPFRRSAYSGRVLRVHENPPDAAWHVGKCEDPRYEAPYRKPYLCNMATGIGYFVGAEHLCHLAREAALVEAELGAGHYDFEDKRVAETLWKAGIEATPLDGYRAVFLDREQRFTAEWRVDPAESHRFQELDVITDCVPDDLRWIHGEASRPIER